MKTTRETILERYHTYTLRDVVLDPKSRKVIFKSLFRTLGPLLPSDKSVRILDAACGEGTLLLFLKENGYVDINGFDMSQECINICHERGLNFVQEQDILTLCELKEVKPYRVIFLMDILEHLPKQSVGPLLASLKQKLEPNGTLVVQVPNMGSILGLYMRYNDPTHEFGVTENSIKGILMAAGFSIENIKVSPAWNATSFLGYLRESYLRILHLIIFLSEGRSRPKIPTKNLLIQATH